MMTSSSPTIVGDTGRDAINTTTQSHSATSGKMSGGNEENDGEDSSADEGADASDEDADATALSGVAQLSMESSGRSAGNTLRGGPMNDMAFLDEDVNMSGSMPATQGAEDAASETKSIDDDYAGLAAVSDDSMSVGSEEQDRLVEQDLVEEYMRQPDSVLNEVDPVTQHLFDPQHYGNTTSGAGGLFSLNDDPFDGAQLFGEQWSDLAGSAEYSMRGEWELENALPAADRPKRVRFQEMAARPRSPSPSSSDSSEDEADSQFPDIFMDQDDPKIKSLLLGDLADAELSGYGSDAGSVYDFEDDADRFAFDVEDEESDSSEYDSATESSDESDDGGYDTEEETPEEAQAAMERMRKTPRPVSTVSAPATPTGGKKRSTASLVRSNSAGKSSSSKVTKGPKQGTFACDPTKATIVSDATGKKTVLYMPRNPEAKDKAFWDRARSTADSRDSSPRGSMSITMPSRGNKEETPQRPFTAQSTLATMFGGNFDFMQSPDVTPAPPPRLQPQASYPPAVPSSFASVATTEASDNEEEFPDINMLVNFDSDSDTAEELVSPSTRPPSPSEPTFLSRGMVGSFRLNQVRAREESSLALHPADRASTSELNALQTGRRGAGNAPITPARKKRVSRDLPRTVAAGIRKAGPSGAASAAGSPQAARRRSRGQSLTGRLDQTLAPDFPIWKR